MVTLIDSWEAAVLTGYHRIHIYTLMKKGDFPPAIYVPGDKGGRPKTHFQKHEVEAWVADRLARKAAETGAQGFSGAPRGPQGQDSGGGGSRGPPSSTK